MQNTPALSLMVIYVADVERSAAFYAALGLSFTQEQHGKGPLHYSAQIGDTVIELYPASQRCPITTTRLGFTVVSIEAVVAQWKSNGYDVELKKLSRSDSLKRQPCQRVVVNDPDGRRIELTQSST